MDAGAKQVALRTEVGRLQQAQSRANYTKVASMAEAMPRSIFISYRRKESLREARGLFERLTREFGAGRVFIDLEGIEPGEDFFASLDKHLDGCAVLIVLISPDWVSAVNRHGKRRIEDENDFVRIEVGAALRRGIRVIPVRFDDAEMPTADELPEDLKPLVRRQSVQLDFSRFNTDIWPLIEAVRRILDTGSSTQSDHIPTRGSEAIPTRVSRESVADPDAGGAPEESRVNLKQGEPKVVVPPSAAEQQTAATVASPGRAVAYAVEASNRLFWRSLRNIPHQRRRIIFLGLATAGLIGTVLTALEPSITGRHSQFLALQDAMVQSQRLAKSMSQALVGSAAAFPEVRDSVEVLTRNLRSLKTGEGDVPALRGGLQGLLDPVMPLLDRAEKNAAVVLAQQKALTQVGQALRAINRQSADLLDTAEEVSSLKIQQGASAAELSAAGQLVMLTQRIGKSANEFLTTEGVTAEAVFLLGKDLNSFKQITQSVIDGNAELRLPATRDPQLLAKLKQLLAQYDRVRGDAAAILGNLQGLVAAKEAQNSVVTDSEPLRRGLLAASEELRVGETRVGLMASFGFLVVLGLWALFVGNDRPERR